MNAAEALRAACRTCNNISKCITNGNRGSTAESSVKIEEST